METILFFLFRSSAGIVLFYLVYWFFLRKETFYIANRWFLLLALVTSVLLPVFPVHYSAIAEPTDNATALRTISDTFKHIPVVSGQESLSEQFNWQQTILMIYLTGVAIFLSRLIIQTFILVHLMIKYRIKSLDGIRVVENERYGLPFSFFNIVFINPKFHTQENLPEILAHEKVHIRENHWFDLLFIELLTVIFWFNPFIWFFERSIKQNHEYLADKGVLAQGHGVGRYQALLINQLMGMQIVGITNNLNFALNTNRLKMMTKTKTSRWLGIKLMWALPAVALLLFAFAEPDYQVQEATSKDSKTFQKDVIADKTVRLAGTVVDENGEPLPGASVVIKGSTVGTVCDIDGKFNLDVPENAAIYISFVGKKTIEDILVIKDSESKEGVVKNKYKMEDAVQWLFNKNYSGEQLPPPPPPPPPPAKEKLVNPAKEKPGKDVPPPPPKAGGEKEAFYIVEDMPQYPGGYKAMQEYILKMQQKIAQSKGVKGKAQVAFTVDGKGKVTDIKVVEKDNDGAAKGAVMVASAMPEWTPGKQRGKAVPVKYLLPVEFK